MEKIYRFKAVIEKAEDMDAAYVVFPYDALKEFGQKRISVSATFDGYPYDGLLVRMGTVNHLLGLPQAIRRAINKQPGDRVEVTITRREPKRR